MHSLRNISKGDVFYYLASFFIPVLILAIIYGRLGIYPGSDTTILASDGFQQFSSFFSSLRHVLHGDSSIFYTWSGSVGLNNYAFVNYYLGGIFSFLVYFVDDQQIPTFVYFLTLLKIGCMGGSFAIFAKNTFELPKWSDFILSCCYALMAYVIAFSEMIMWLDGLVYLPLIILGIHRLLAGKSSALLFTSYVLLFVSNYYIGFMVGLYSFIYFFVRLFIQRGNWKKNTVRYLVTSFLAGGSAMFTLLPTAFDLWKNGEGLSEWTQIKTNATHIFDLIVKQMIGVYDTTKFDSIPFIYVGILPLLLGIYFFLSRNISGKTKIGYGSLLGILALSFYIEPLNLFWQGMHAPNMFLFRFSFLFSFTLLVVAGYGWSIFEKENRGRWLNLFLGLLVIYILTFVVSTRLDMYTYLSSFSFIVTVAFVCFYGFLFYFCDTNRLKRSNTIFSIMCVLLVVTELVFNTSALIEKGITKDWIYPQKALYERDAADIIKLKEQLDENDLTFYRMESLTPITDNDALRFNYPGISLFSSIRNRPAFNYLNGLGYRSVGSNLKIHYPNNSIIMDSIMGVKYNLSNQDSLKFGFNKIAEEGELQLHENRWALPLGIMTDEKIYNEEVNSNQFMLLNQLSGRNVNYGVEVKPVLQRVSNADLNKSEVLLQQPIVLNSKSDDTPITLYWQVEVPANTQAYMDIYTNNYSNMSGAWINFKVNGQIHMTEMAESGRYYSLGTYEERQTLEIEMEILNADYFSIYQPSVILMSTEALAESFQAAQENGVELLVDGNTVSGEINSSDKNVLFTTIPYDSSWRAELDGDPIEIEAVNSGLISIKIPEGKHHLSMTFIPEGLVLGISISIISVTLFFGVFVLENRRKKQQNLMLDKSVKS